MHRVKQEFAGLWLANLDNFQIADHSPRKCWFWVVSAKAYYDSYEDSRLLKPIWELATLEF